MTDDSDALFGEGLFTAMHARNLKRGAILQAQQMLFPSCSAGIYWQRTGGKTHRVTIVREDEPMTFRGIPVRVQS